MDLDFVSVLKNAERERGQYSAILTSHLVNDVYFSDNLFGKNKNSNNNKQRNERCFVENFVEKCSLNELIISFNCFGFGVIPENRLAEFLTCCLSKCLRRFFQMSKYSRTQERGFLCCYYIVNAEKSVALMPVYILYGITSKNP